MSTRKPGFLLLPFIVTACMLITGCVPSVTPPASSQTQSEPEEVASRPDGPVVDEGEQALFDAYFPVWLEYEEVRSSLLADAVVAMEIDDADSLRSAARGFGVLREKLKMSRPPSDMQDLHSALVDEATELERALEAWADGAHESATMMLEQASEARATIDAEMERLGGATSSM